MTMEPTGRIEAPPDAEPSALRPADLGPQGTAGSAPADSEGPATAPPTVAGPLATGQEDKPGAQPRGEWDADPSVTPPGVVRDPGGDDGEGSTFLVHDADCERGYSTPTRGSRPCGCWHRAEANERADRALMNILEGNLRVTLDYYNDVMKLGRIAEIITEVTGQQVIICSPAVATLLNRFAVEPTVDDLTALAMALTGKEITSLVIGWADE